MAAIYDFRENPNPAGEEREQILHPRIVLKETISTERLLKDIVSATSLTEPDMRAALSVLSNRMLHYMLEGHTVELEGIGKFFPTLKGPSVKNKKEIRAASVHFDTVRFRPASRLRNELRSGTVLRASAGTRFKKSSSLSAEERKARVANHLNENPFITRAEYSELTGRLRTKAIQDLKEWITQGYLIRCGSKNSTFYMPGKNYGSFLK